MLSGWVSIFNCIVCPVAAVCLLNCTLAHADSIDCMNTVPLGAVRAWRGSITDSRACDEHATWMPGTLRQHYAAPGWALGKGVQTMGNMLRIRQFAGKLLRGENVTVSVAGGSVSRGWGDTDELGFEGRGCVVLA